MPYTWPIEIPPPSQSFTGAAASNVLRDNSPNGVIDTRFRNNVITRTYQLTWELLDLEREAWIEAYNAAINGNGFVYMELPLRGSMEVHRVRFSSQGYTQSHGSHFNWNISLDVEIFDLQLLTSDEIESLVTWEENNYPQELPLPNAAQDQSNYLGNSRTDFDNTMTRQRQRFSKELRSYSLSFFFTQQEKYIFESIYQNKLKSGTLGMGITLPISKLDRWCDECIWGGAAIWGKYAPIFLRFGQNYSFAMESADNYTLSINCDEDLKSPISPVTIQR
jgi:hypothetical protein